MSLLAWDYREGDAALHFGLSEARRATFELSIDGDDRTLHIVDAEIRVLATKLLAYLHVRDEVE